MSGDLLDAFYELQEDSGNVSPLCPSHGTLLETAVLSSECKHTSYLHTQGLPTLLLTRVLGGWGEGEDGEGRSWNTSTNVQYILTSPFF